VPPVTIASRAALALLLALLCVRAAPAKVIESTLPNGLKILIKEDHRAPVVVCMVWYRAGSMDEFNGTTGVAHMLEHMMFQGTAKVPGGEFSRIIARAGGRDNAFTNRDSTVYHQQLHKSKLALVLELEADRMANLQLSNDQFARELKVVMEERRLRTDDQPKSLVYEAFMAAAYTANPYRTPVVGWMTDLQSLTADDARSWYRRWYAPNNATLVVVGDVSAAEVIEEAEKYFGPIGAHALPERKPQLEAAQRGTRRVSVRAPAELPYVMLGWHVPSLRDPERDWEPYALEMLAAVLDGSDAARLDRELVRESRLALSAGADYSPINRGPGLFVMDGTPAPGKSVDDLEKALRAQIQRILAQGVTDEEMRRAKAQATASQVFQLDSMFAQAREIGALDNAGLPPDSVELQARKLAQVTGEQVREVARKYLHDDNLTIAVLEPEPLGERKPAPPPPAEHRH